jgi:Tol biopolymer transport system component
MSRTHTPKLTLLTTMLLAAVSSPLASQQTADSGDRSNRPLALEGWEESRSLNVDLDEGSWMSLDVSPDGRTIVFDFLGDLFTMPIAGGDATQLPSGMAFDAQPRFSPDGARVAFTSDRDGGQNIWIIPLDRSDTTQIPREHEREALPAWRARNG